MSQRLRGMCRILALQEQIRRIAEGELAAIEQRQAALTEQRAGLDALIDGGDLAGPLAGAALGQRRRVQGREEQAEQERAAQALVTREAQGRCKLAERLVGELARDDRAARERRELEQMIVGVARAEGDAGASLP